MDGGTPASACTEGLHVRWTALTNSSSVSNPFRIVKVSATRRATDIARAILCNHVLVRQRKTHLSLCARQKIQVQTLGPPRYPRIEVALGMRPSLADQTSQKLALDHTGLRPLWQPMQRRTLLVTTGEDPIARAVHRGINCTGGACAPHVLPTMTTTKKC